MAKFYSLNDEVIKNEWMRLNEIDSKLVVLYGSGKRSVIENNEFYKNNGILISFNSSGFSEKSFDEKFLRHYYELLFAMKLIKCNLSDDSIKKKYSDDLYFLLKNVDDYINCQIYKDTSFSPDIKTFEYTGAIVDEIKNKYSKEKIGLLLKRFDGIHGNSSRIQLILQEYFKLFDQTIVTAENCDEYTISKLTKSGASFYQVSYGMNFDFVKSLALEYIDNYNEYVVNYNNSDGHYRLLGIKDVDDIDDIISELVNRCNGNIAMMIETIRESVSDFEWNRGTITLKSAVSQNINQNLLDKKNLEKSSLKHKLYIK